MFDTRFCLDYFGAYLWYTGEIIGNVGETFINYPLDIQLMMLE